MAIWPYAINRGRYLKAIGMTRHLSADRGPWGVPGSGPSYLRTLLGDSTRMFRYKKLVECVFIDFSEDFQFFRQGINYRRGSRGDGCSSTTWSRYRFLFGS